MNLTRPASKQPIPDNAKKVFSGILFDVYQWEQVLYDGTTTTFEKVKRKDTVGILAVTKDKKILLTHQEQPGTTPFIGTPGGIIDPHEDTFESAKRELLEETGYISSRWELFDATQPTSKIDWAIYTFLAKDCTRVQDAHLDSGEKVSTREVDWKEFLSIITNDSFRDHSLALKILKILRSPSGEEQLKKQIL